MKNVAMTLDAFIPILSHLTFHPSGQTHFFWLVKAMIVRMQTITNMIHVQCGGHAHLVGLEGVVVIPEWRSEWWSCAGRRW